MNFQTLKRHQKEQGYAEMQSLIDSGNAWLFEGSVGRSAMDCLRSGACWLPKKRMRDYYGSTVPSRDDVKAGSTGSYQNSLKFYTANQW